MCGLNLKYVNLGLDSLQNINNALIMVHLDFTKVIKSTDFIYYLIFNPYFEFSQAAIHFNDLITHYIDAVAYLVNATTQPVIHFGNTITQLILTLFNVDHFLAWNLNLTKNLF